MVPGRVPKAKTRERAAGRGGRPESGLEVLLVTDVGNGSLVLVAATGSEGVLAAGHDVFGADGELAAPGRSPGESHPKAAPLARNTRGVDDAADDVGAKIAHPGADGEGLAGPAVGYFGRDVVRRDQAGPGQGAANGDGCLAADVFLAVEGKTVLVELAGLVAGAEPSGQGVACRAQDQAHAAAAVAQTGSATELPVGAAIAITVERGKHAVVGEAAYRRGQPVLAIAYQAQRIAGSDAESGVQGIAAHAPAGTGNRDRAGFELEDGFELAVGVPHREQGRIGAPRGLRMHARSHAKGEQQG